MEPARRHPPLAAVSPLEAFERVSAFPGVAFLDGGASRSHLAWSPSRRLEIDRDGRACLDGVAGLASAPLSAVAGFVDRETASGRTVIGALSYDLRTWIEPRAGRARASRWPLAVLHAYDTEYTWEPAHGWLSPLPALPEPRLESATLGEPRPALDRASYRRLFERVHDALRAGEIYQANLAFAFAAEVTGPASTLHRLLSARHPAPYGAYLDCGAFQIVSNSPELLLERSEDRIVTRPIKGTRRRGRDASEDRRLREELRRDAKERAEHVMIVDLERNDLGRVAETGSVRVEELAQVVTLGSIHHLESTVSARLRRDVGTEALLRATFPGGSITGAPKIRAMQIIADVEPESRAFYTGAILRAAPGGALTASVNIRSAIVAGGEARYFAGGGIVFDSTSDGEYDECWLKAQAFFASARRCTR